MKKGDQAFQLRSRPPTLPIDRALAGVLGERPSPFTNKPVGSPRMFTNRLAASHFVCVSVFPVLGESPGHNIYSTLLAVFVAIEKFRGQGRSLVC